MIYTEKHNCTEYVDCMYKVNILEELKKGQICTLEKRYI